MREKNNPNSAERLYIAGAAALGDGVALDAEQTAPVGDKEHIVVGGAYERCV